MTYRLLSQRQQASISRRRFFWQGVLVILFGVSPTAAETIRIDDFNDGVPDGWSIIDPTPGTPWGPGNFYVNGKGEFQLAGNGPVPVWGGPADFLASEWEASSDSLYSEGWLQARVRVGEPFNNPGIAMRNTGSLETGFSSYLFRLYPDLGPSDPAIPKGIICIERIGGPEGGDECARYPHRVDEDLWVQGGAVGDEITMKVWRPDELEPPEPQITMIDPHHSQGTFGVLSARHTNHGGWTFISELSATFDDITFTPADSGQIVANSPIGVPEPSGLMGMIAAALTLVLFGHRRAGARPRCMPSYRSAVIGALAAVLLAIGGIVGKTAQAQQFEIDLGTIRPDAIPLEIPISIPEGTYNSILLMTDWSTPSGAWSREAIWTLIDGELAEPGTLYYANLSSAPNSAADSEPVTLVWDSFLDIPLHGPADLTLLAVHTVDGQTPRWDDTVIQFSLETPPSHPALTADLGTVAAEFDPIRLVTEGDFDTELGIYPKLTGDLIERNDDSLSKELRNTTHSEISFESGLPHGDYIVALGGFNTTFDDQYDIIAGAAGGNYSLSAGDASVTGSLAANELAYVAFTISGQPADGLKAGDADQDLDFDQFDLVRVQTAARYLTGQAATWGEGDWDGAPGGEPGNPPAGNGLFDQSDVISALSAGTYLTGPYTAVQPNGQPNDGQTSLIYNTATGEVAVDAPVGVELTSINIDSAAGVFTGAAAQSLGGSFDNDADDNIFKATFGGSFGSLTFGNVATAGLSEEFVLGDLTVIGSLAGGGDLGNVDLVYVPEPASVLLLSVGLAIGLLHFRRVNR